MFFITSNRSKQLLYFTFIGRVEVEELARGMADLAGQLAELELGFRVLGDLERLESMCVGGSAEIGKAMELCDQKGVGFIVRVIPDQAKDIGFGILASFHYRQAPRTATCTSMAEAAKLLSL